MMSVEKFRHEEFERAPGLFRRWELVRLIEPGYVYLIENAGATGDGSPVFALYQQSERLPTYLGRPGRLQ